MSKKKKNRIAFVRCAGNVLHGKRVEVIQRTAAGSLRCKLLEQAECYTEGSFVLLGPGELTDKPEGMPLCGDCKHPNDVHTKLPSSSGLGRGIAWCRIPSCMCRGYVIDAAAERV